MISIILSIISSLFSAAGKLFDWLYAKQMIDAGKTAQQVEDLRKQIDAAHQALKARIDVERDIAANPDSLFDDDNFKRPD